MEGRVIVALKTHHTQHRKLKCMFPLLCIGLSLSLSYYSESDNSFYSDES